MTCNYLHYDYPCILCETTIEACAAPSSQAKLRSARAPTWMKYLQFKFPIKRSEDRRAISREFRFTSAKTVNYKYFSNSLPSRAECHARIVSCSERSIVDFRHQYQGSYRWRKIEGVVQDVRVASNNLERLGWVKERQISKLISNADIGGLKLRLLSIDQLGEYFEIKCAVAHRRKAESLAIDLGFNHTCAQSKNSAQIFASITSVGGKND